MAISCRRRGCLQKWVTWITSTCYWVDIVGQTVYGYHLPDNVLSSWRLSQEVSSPFPSPTATCWLVFVTGFTIAILKAVRRCQLPFSIFRVAIA